MTDLISGDAETAPQTDVDALVARRVLDLLVETGLTRHDLVVLLGLRSMADMEARLSGAQRFLPHELAVLADHSGVSVGFFFER